MAIKEQIDYGFEAALDAFEQGAFYNAVRRIAKMARRLHHKICVKTPVDTGLARMNWRLSLYRPNTRVTKPPGGRKMGPQEALEEAKRSAGVLNGYRDPSIPIFISNGVKYIHFLEEGTSTHKANAMVALSRLEIEQEFNQMSESEDY